MGDISEVARREAARILDARFGGSNGFAQIAHFEIETARERVLVIVVERTSHASSPDSESVVTEFGLTQREAEVASALAERKSSSEIARALGISPHTARRHAERVLDKLGVRSRRDVADVLHRRRAGRG
jgi:DNA-binding CsgD family transcriptional regulator